MTDEAGQLGAWDSGETRAGVEPMPGAGGQAAPAGDGEPDEGQEDGAGAKANWRRRITVMGGVILLVASAVVLPPLVNIGRYQRQVTALMTRAMGRPVRLSSVELRVLPRPGFVLHDLAVAEDPNFGYEPILSARTVAASVAILPLWKGQLEIDRVSVDEASLNLVRNAQGRWNLESLMLGAEPELTGAGAAAANRLARGRRIRFPYLEATDSRVNMKNGAEKSPYSVVNTDLSLWQDEPGAWRVRLRGQPVRTDIQMSPEDTGEVRLEASLRTQGELREMPLHLQMEWRNAQLGQLSRLILGSDEGWRGALTADIDVIGSPESAQTRARLRATGVRREEFAPDTPLDFDANCNFRFQRSRNAFHGVSCDSAIGNGRLHLKAELPGALGEPSATLEVEQAPLQAGLDLLRTVRNGFAPGITVQGTANGSVEYRVAHAADAVAGRPSRPGARAGSRGVLRAGKATGDAAAAASLGSAASSAVLEGAITVDGAVLRGGALKQPMVLPRMEWTPVKDAPTTASSGNGPGQNTQPGTRPAMQLGTRFTILPAATGQARTPAEGREAAAASGGVTVGLEVAAAGFQATAAGSASLARLRDLAYALGAPHLDAVNDLASGSVDVAMSASGPWIPSEGGPGGALSGSLALHHAQWKPPYLARPVDLSEGTVAIDGGAVTMTSQFSIAVSSPLEKEAPAGAIQGTVKVSASAACAAEDCRPRVELYLGSMDASVVQAALLGAPERKTLLSPLIDEMARMSSTAGAKWPDATVVAQAESVVLGPVTLSAVTVQMHLADGAMAIESWQAQALGGSAQGTGSVGWAADRPEYTLEGSFSGLNAAQVGMLLGGGTGSRWSGGPLSGSGKAHLAGLAARDLAASATGELRFNWPRGSLAPEAPQAPIRFDGWSGSAAIQGGKLVLGANSITIGRRASSVAGSILFGGAEKLTVVPLAPVAGAAGGRASSNAAGRPESGPGTG